MPITRIITVVVITAGPARREGWAAWKLGLGSGCLAQPTNLHHINPRHLRSGLEVLVRCGSPSATSGSRARSWTDAGTGVPSARCVQGADPLGIRGPAGGPSLPPMQPLCLPRGGEGGCAMCPGSQAWAELPAVAIPLQEVNEPACPRPPAALGEPGFRPRARGCTARALRPSVSRPS